jgi:long-chain acyl-CoA synthetase
MDHQNHIGGTHHYSLAAGSMGARHTGRHGQGDINPKEHKLSHWRLMHMGAQPIPPSLIRRWSEYFPDQDYDTNYGLSEAIGPGCINLGLDNSHKVGAIGTAGHGWRVKIAGEGGRPVKQGKVGELCVKGRGHEVLLQKP